VADRVIRLLNVTALMMVVELIVERQP